MTIRTRFAPSPTGYLHVGGARTALFSWLYARKHGGTFVLRIEDTDLERSTAESVDAILQGMTWLGLEYDEGPFFQSHRFPRYQQVIEQMLAAGTAYHCYCSKERLEQLRADQMARKEKPRYDGRCRHGVAQPPAGVPPVVRFKNPEDGATVVEDLVRGRVAFQNRELDDLIIARSDGTPTYNFTVVVDDMDMRITHVIRHGAVSVMQYREDGFLPEALLNYLARLGWSHGDQEIFALDELIKLFDVTNVHSSAASFDPQKLQWLNQHYLKTADPAHVAHHLSWHLGRLGVDPASGPALPEVVVAQRERAKTLAEMAQNSAFFYQDPAGYDPKDAAAHLRPEIAGPLSDLRARFVALSDWTAPALHEAVNAVATAHGLKLGKLAQPLRVAVTGRALSPPIDITLALTGRERVLKRLDAALAYLSRLDLPGPGT